MDQGRAERVLERLRRKGRPEAGFLYGKAIGHIFADFPGITWDALAEAIDCSPGQLRKYWDTKKGSIPNHITGSLLWGVLSELYGDKKRRELFLTKAQRDGGKLLK